MATRSIIGSMGEDGKISYVYCHWDGYTEGVGEDLKKHYTTPEKVNELISMGGISSLAENIHPNPNFEHSFNNPQEGVTVFYHRDRGEKLSIRNCSGIDTFLNYMALEEYGQEYCYLYNCFLGVWLYSKVYSNRNMILREL